MKKIISVTVAMILMLTLAGCSKEEPASAEKEARTAGSYNTIEEGGLNFQIPDYFGDPQMSGEVKNFYAEKGDGLSVLQMCSLDGILDEDNFENNCKELYDGYVSGLKGDDGVSDFREGSSDDTTIGCGLHCMLYNYGFTMSGIGFNSVLTFINNTESNKVIMVSIMQSDQSEYDYFDAYTELVDTCKLISGDAGSSDGSDDADDSSGSDSGLLSPEFKQTMDDYEAWFDHYCEVMKKCKENPSDLELLTEMTDLLSEETIILEEMEKMDQSEMNAAELAYYFEVTARIEKKLLEVGY